MQPIEVEISTRKAKTKNKMALAIIKNEIEYRMRERGIPIRITFIRTDRPYILPFASLSDMDIVDEIEKLLESSRKKAGKLLK